MMPKLSAVNILSVSGRRAASRWPIASLRGLVVSFFLGLMLVACQAGWSAEPMTITPDVLMTRLDSPQGLVILDVRSEAEYAEGHIPGALNIPYREIPDRLDELDGFKTHEIVLYCEVGVRAGIADLVLEQAGFQRTIPLQGDMRAWRQQGFPIATR